MSEAEIHQNDPGSSEPNESNQEIHSSADSTNSNINQEHSQPQDAQPVDSTGEFRSIGDLEPAVASDLVSDDAGINSEIADALTWQSDTDIAELVTLSESLQQQNKDLLDHVEQLEKLLDECHSALQLQMKRNQTLETRISQQTEEMTATQEQVGRLFRELEASHQVAQRQQILIETLSQQLETSQEQVAQLERECAFTQQRYNEQAYNLSQSEMLCQELRSRLDRQQRYTLQFKAALDKCIEVPAHTDIDLSNIPSTAELKYYPQNAAARQHLILKPQPIKPWSANSDFLAEETITNETESPSMPAINSPWEEQETGEVSVSTEFVAENKQATASEALTDTILSQPEPTPNLPTDLPVEETNELIENLNEAEEGLWEELARITEATVAQTKVNLPKIETPTEPSTLLNPFDEVINLPEVPVSKIENTPEQRGELILPEPISQSNLVPSQSEEFGDLTESDKSPSPTVYPARPHKKIKSLAAIDLPSFPRLDSK